MKDARNLIETAKAIIDNAYAPYSNYKVAACVEDDEGNIYTGVNIENISYGATVCAERIAVFNGITNGSRKFTRIAIYSTSEDYTVPCGICRQVMSEFFHPDAKIICSNKTGDYKEYKLNDLFPHPFKKF